MPCNKGHEKLQPSPSRTTNSPDPLGLKMWVTLPCEQPWPAEVFAEGKEERE